MPSRTCALACALLVRTGMVKPLLASSLLATLLCGPALADPSVAPTTTYVIELATKTQRHVIFVADRSCGEVQYKAPQREQFFRVCATASDAKHVRLDVERRTRDNHDEARTSAVVMASTGASFDLLDAKMTVKTQ